MLHGYRETASGLGLGVGPGRSRGRPFYPSVSLRAYFALFSVQKGVPLASLERGIRVAESAAKQSACFQFRVGAALLRKKQVVRTGRNSPSTHPKSKTRFCKIHAEFDCLVGLTSEDCDGATLYVVRLRRRGERAMARPCPHCWLLAQRLGVRKVVYTNQAGEAVEERLR